MDCVLRGYGVGCDGCSGPEWEPEDEDDCTITNTRSKSDDRSSGIFCQCLSRTFSIENFSDNDASEWGVWTLSFQIFYRTIK